MASFTVTSYSGPRCWPDSVSRVTALYMASNRYQSGRRVQSNLFPAECKFPFPRPPIFNPKFLTGSDCRFLSPSPRLSNLNPTATGRLPNLLSRDRLGGRAIARSFFHPGPGKFCDSALKMLPKYILDTRGNIVRY